MKYLFPLLVITYCYSTTGFILVLVGAALPTVADDFEVSLSAVGLSFFCVFAGASVTLIVATWLFASFRVRLPLWKARDFACLCCGKQWMVPMAQTVGNWVYKDRNRLGLFIGLAVGAASSCGLWIMPPSHDRFPVFLVLLFCNGISVAFLDLSTNNITAEWEGLSAAAINLLHFGFGIGAVIMPFMVQLLDDNWRACFGITSLHCLICAILIVFVDFMPKITLDSQQAKVAPTSVDDVQPSFSENGALVKEMQIINDEELEEQKAATPPLEQNGTEDKVAKTKNLKRRHSRIRELASEGGFWLCCWSIFSYMGIEQGVAGWLSALYEELEEDSYSQLSLALFWAGLLAGRLSSSFLALKFAKTHDGGNMFLIISSIFTGIFTLILYAEPHPTISLVWVVIIGFFCSCQFPMVVAIAAMQYQSPRSKSTVTTVATVILCANAGGAILPSIQGVIADKTSVRYSMLYGAIWSVSLLLSSLAYRWRYVRHTNVVASPMPVENSTPIDQAPASPN